MGKRDNIREITRLISLAATHIIGYFINPNSVYAEKYRKEFDNFIMQSKIVKLRENWNSYDKNLIKQEARKKTKDELTKRTHIDKIKFDLIYVEIDKVLRELALS